MGLRCVTGMEPENPGVGVYRDNHNDKVFLLPTAETASGMARALAVLAPSPAVWPTAKRSARRRTRAMCRAAFAGWCVSTRAARDRAIDMLLAKIDGKPFDTEIPMEVWDKVEPAAPLADAAAANLAVICTGGVVPWGNPGRLQNLSQYFLA